MKKRYLPVIFLGLMTSPAFAQDDAVGGEMEIMDEIVVTASKVKEVKKEVTTNIVVIKEKEINLSSADNLGDLFAEKGIGHIHKRPGCDTRIGIRGFRTDTGSNLKGRVLILLNGRKAGTGNVAKIMTKNIERIEIIRGPASVQYGSSAIGGLINVITKEGKGKPSAFAEGNLGSFDYQEAGVGGSGEVKGFDFSVSFSRSTRDNGYDNAEGDKYYNSGYDKKEHASLNLG
ncbi:MAG: TonB-dependent receptor, partial [Thermodesulfobacteriota bacterium]